MYRPEETDFTSGETTGTSRGSTSHGRATSPPSSSRARTTSSRTARATTTAGPEAQPGARGFISTPGRHGKGRRTIFSLTATPITTTILPLRPAEEITTDLEPTEAPRCRWDRTTAG